jgi:hypothetical protein
VTTSCTSETLQEESARGAKHSGVLRGVTHLPAQLERIAVTLFSPYSRFNCNIMAVLPPLLVQGTFVKGACQTAMSVNAT